MKWHGEIAALGALALLAGMSVPVLAQTQSVPQDQAGGQTGVPTLEDSEAVRAERLQQADRDRIVVTTSVDDASRAEVHMQARAIAVSGNVYDVPLARFEVPLCPGIAGLTPDTAALLIDRIRANARFVDLRVQDDGCEPNFVVAFVDDGQAMLSRMIDDNPQRFQYLSSVEKRAMLRPGPVRVWTDVQPASLTGQPIARVRNLVDPPRTSAWVAHSLIYTATRNDIVTVWVIIDRIAARGMSVVQLADYATMRGLVQTQPSGNMDVSSILGLFEENGPWPEELTDFDRAYLTAVYDWIPNLPAAAKLARVASTLRRLQEEGDAGE